MKSTAQRAIIGLIAITVITQLIISCGGAHDADLVGKWQLIGVQMNRWDMGAMPPGEEHVYELFDDGTGFLKKGEQLENIRWSTSTQSLTITNKLSDKERFGYLLKDNRLLLSDEDQKTTVYVRRS